MQMNRIIGLFFIVSLAAAVWLFWVKAPTNGVARKVLVFARVMAVLGGLAVLSAMICLMNFSLLGTAEDVILFEQQSPDKIYTLAAFNRYGGATVNNTTVVSIRLNGEKLDTKKNAIVFRVNGTSKISAVWDGNKHLVIHSIPGEVYNQVTNWQDVSITYITSNGSVLEK